MALRRLLLAGLVCTTMLMLPGTASAVPNNCGGNYVVAASCSFTAYQDVAVRGIAYAGLSITIEARDAGGNLITSCTALPLASCFSIVPWTSPPMPMTCTVTGWSVGVYACASN